MPNLPPSRPLFLFVGRRVPPDKRKPAFQFGSEISRFGGDLDRLSSGFPSQPVIQIVGQSKNAPTLVGNGHSRLGPPLGYRDWLTQELRDLLPAIQRAGFVVRFGHGGAFPRASFDA